MPYEPDSEDELPEIQPGPEITPELFFQWRAPRFGSANPERMSNSVWIWLVKSKLNAFQANERFGGEDALLKGPGWCFDRFGQSSTKLSDGTIVFIAGEHEDYYDPDFYIYNDVVVQHPTGDIDIFGYPREIFPPTDFHSATLVGEHIIMIGNLGHPEQRKAGSTQVYSLNVRDFAISVIHTTGTSPGWIHRHEASLAEDRGSIIIRRGLVDRTVPGESLVENLDDWRLDLVSWNWERLTERNWKRWEVRRKDHKPNHLWQYGQELWKKRFPNFATEIQSLADVSLEQELGCQPNLDLFESLYKPEVPHETIPDVEGEYRVLRIRVEGVVVRYVESGYAVQCTVEGELTDSIVKLLKHDLLDKFAKLENSVCELAEL